MKKNMSMPALVILTLAILVTGGAQAATGFNQTGAGPYDYNATSNWVSDIINGVWDTSLTLGAAQTVTFASNTSLTTGLAFTNGGNYALSLTASTAGTQTMTLGGDISVNTSGGTAASVTIGNAANHLNVNLGGTTRTMTVATNRTLTLVDVVSNGGLTKAGAGTLTLLGANTYSGTTISGGMLQVGNGGTTGSLGSGSIIDNGTLTYNLGSGTTLTLPSGAAISGSGNISASAGVIQINGNITLGGSQSYIQNSTSAYYKGLEVPSSSTLTGSAITLTGDVGKQGSGGNTLTLDTSATNGPINLNISVGRANVWYFLSSFTANAGTGTVTVSGGNSPNGFNATTIFLTGGLLISSGIPFGGAATLHATAASTVSGPLGLGGATIFNVDTNISMQVSGQLYNSGSLNKQGAGTLVLSGFNTYSGATLINAGKLVGVVGGACSNSAVSVAATSGNSAILGVLITDNTKQWTCSSLTVNNAGTGANLDFSFGYVAPSLTLAPLNVTGAVTFTTSPTITVSGYNIGGATNTVYPLMAWSGSSVSAPSVTVTGLGSISAHTTVTGTSPNFTLNLVIDTNLEPLTWAVGGSGFWDTSTANWTNGGGATVTYSEVTLPGDQVLFSDAGLSADATVTLNSTLKPASVTVTNSAYNYTFSGSGAVAGGASLTKSGTKTLTLLTNNTYTGGTMINGGTLQVGNGGTTGSLGSGPVIDNGTLSYNLGSATTLSLPSGTAISGSGNISASAGVIQFNGNITLGGSQSFIQNSTAALYKGLEVPSSSMLTGSAITLTGDVGKQTSNGNTLTLDTSATNGPINLNISIGRNGVWYALSSFTANAGTGAVTVSGVNAGNSQSMPGSYTLSGGLNIQSSLIGYNSTATAPTINLRATAASIVSGNVTMGGTANNFNVDTGVTMVVSGVLGGAAAPLMKQGAGTLVLSAKNTYTGGTTVGNGTLSLLGSLTSSSVSTVGTGAFIEAVTGSIAGNGVSFTQGSTGSSLFGGVNTYTGGTTVSNGTLTVSLVSSLGSNSVATVRGGTLAFEAGTGGRVISNDLVLTGGAVLGGYRAASGSGGIITSDGVNVRHTFTNVGNSTLTFSATVTNVSGVVVGGGGGAGGQQSGISWLAGGAGGQVTSFTNVFLAAGSTTITVGGGGAYNVANIKSGNSGGNSSIGTYTSGGMYSATGGFGGGSNGTYVAGQGGTSPGNIINGVLQSGSPFAGGVKDNSTARGGGGAGAGGVGASGATGNGGIGVTVDRIGLFGGGGNGAGGSGTYGIGATAYGGGTQGNGLASTGGGGGALGGNAAGGNGGSGIVIIQYPYTDYAAGTLTLAGSISVQSNSTLNVYTGGAIVISGAMTNTANLTQIGSGSLLINGTVTGGVITVSSGVFGGTGVVSGTVTNWAALSAGATNTLGTLTVKNLVMTENSTVTWNYDSTTSDVIQVSGTLTLPTVATVNVSRVSGTWPTNPSVLFNVTGSVQGAPSLANWVVTGDCRPGTKVVLQDNQVLIGLPRGTFIRFF